MKLGKGNDGEITTKPVLNPHGSDETGLSEDLVCPVCDGLVLNPHGSDETFTGLEYPELILAFLTHTVQMKPQVSCCLQCSVC